MNENTRKIRKLVYSAICLALCMVLPFFTGHIPQIGKMLSPMHIPVFLCGMLCGFGWGAAVGFIAPLLRSVAFGMPALFPGGVAMAFELATYAFVAGYLYGHSRWQCSKALLRCIVIAMIAGRVVWGIVQLLLLGIGGKAFTFQAFLAGALLNAIPGIIIQLILIPAIMIALHRTKLVPFVKNDGKDLGTVTK